MSYRPGRHERKPSQGSFINFGSLPTLVTSDSNGGAPAPAPAVPPAPPMTPRVAPPVAAPPPPLPAPALAPKPAVPKENAARDGAAKAKDLAD
ncbi:Cysteine protease [Psidium guajava]|nr:Cysteine protease [Psidium guajava]